MSDIPNKSGFLKGIGDAIGKRAHAEIAVTVIVAATPNQHAELVHTLGDVAAELLETALAEWIGEQLPAGTTFHLLSFARFGCILEAETRSQIEEMLDELACKISRPTAGRAIPVATSLGIGVAYYPHDGAGAGALLEAAGVAAQESLDSVMPWSAYSPALDRASRRAAALLRDIGSALAGEGQLYLVYQPKQDLRSGRCVSAEALLRWTHPTLGAIPPGEFVPLIERTTLVHALTEWVFGAALGQVARWRAAGLDIKVSINVSMLDLRDRHFSARVTELLERHAVRPDWIDIEVTEGALMKDPAVARRQLDALRQLGVGIEIDDFGTGRSTLSYLKYIPATEVKIDQLFVSRLIRNTHDQIIVRSTIDLVHELGCRVVAEGIEDEATCKWLREHDCDIGQGNAISPPLEAQHFEQWLRTANAARIS